MQVLQMKSDNIDVKTWKTNKQKILPCRNSSKKTHRKR